MACAQYSDNQRYAICFQQRSQRKCAQPHWSSLHYALAHRIVAAQFSGDGSYSRFIDSIYSDNFHFSRDGGNNAVLGGIAANTSPYGAILDINDDVFYTFRLLFDGTTTVITKNNTISSSPYTNGTPGSARPLSMFASVDGGFFGKKAIAELIIYDDILTSDEIEFVETYLRNKWGHY